MILFVFKSYFRRFLNILVKTWTDGRRAGAESVERVKEVPRGHGKPEVMCE
jgi:hypothetical protein